MFNRYIFRAFKILLQNIETHEISAIGFLCLASSYFDKDNKSYVGNIKFLNIFIRDWVIILIVIWCLSKILNRNKKE